MVYSIVYWKYTAEYVSEIILEIDQYLMKL